MPVQREGIDGSKRAELSRRIQILLHANTDAWGIKGSAVTLRDVSLVETMIRGIAKQAEAARERRSRVTMAEGESQAAERMKGPLTFAGRLPQRCACGNQRP